MLDKTAINAGNLRQFTIIAKQQQHLFFSFIFLVAKIQAGPHDLANASPPYAWGLLQGPQEQLQILISACSCLFSMSL